MHYHCPNYGLLLGLTSLIIIIYPPVFHHHSINANYTWRSNLRDCGKTYYSPDISDCNESDEMGGREARPHSWPWYAAIYRTAKSETGRRYLCGGSLIAERWILTAAHCLHKQPSKVLYELNGFRIHLGIHNCHHFGRRSPNYNMGSEEPGGLQILTVDRAWIHPNYSQDSRSPDNIGVINDLALMHLSSRVVYGPKVRPICLPESFTTTQAKAAARSSHCHVVGLGSTMRYFTHFSPHLNQVCIPLNLGGGETTCSSNSSSATTTTKTNCIGEGWFRAGRGNKDACAGDSGGPLMCLLNMRRWVVAGIVSFGTSVCGDPVKASVYTRVSNYRHLIDWVVEGN